jgi:hypothetical protein
MIKSRKLTISVLVGIAILLSVVGLIGAFGPFPMVVDISLGQENASWIGASYRNGTGQSIAHGDFNGDGLDLNTNTWTELTPSISPSERCEPAFAVYRDSSGAEKLFLFGGYDGSQWLSDMWSYDFSTNEWMEIAPTGDPVSGVVQAIALFDPSGQRILLVGGGRRVYQVDVNTRVVTLLDNDVRHLGPPPGTAAFWDEARRRVVVYNQGEIWYDNCVLKYALGGTRYFGEPDYILPLTLFVVKNDCGFDAVVTAIWYGGLGPYTIFETESRDFSNPVRDPVHYNLMKLEAFFYDSVPLPPPPPMYLLKVEGR